MCAYKSLVWDYWLWQGAGGHLPKLIAANHAGLTFIDTAAVLANPLAYAQGRPGDAGIFYDWVTNQMQYAIPAPLPADQRYKLHWNEEFKAMFQMDMSKTMVCQNEISGRVCGNIKITPAETMRSIEVVCDPLLQTLEEMVDYRLTGFDYLDELCTKCDVYGPHTLRSTIRAAPQVLIIRVKIVRTAAGGTTKYLNGWTVPEKLNLTCHLENDELPLEYALSSSIAHGEDRPNHYDTEVDAIEVVVPVGGNEADPAPRDIELGPEGQDADMAEDEDEDFDPNDQYDDLFNVSERADSVMAEDEPQPVMPTASQDEDEELDEDDEAAPPRDYGLPHLVPKDFVAGGFAQRIPVRGEDDHFNGLIPVTNEEFLEELGPSMDMDMDDLPNYTDTEGEDDDEDEQEYELEELEHLNRSDGSASPPQDGSDASSDADGGVLDDFVVEVVNNNAQVELIADEDITEAPLQLDDDMYDTDEEPVVPNSHYIINVRGPGDNNKYHISKAHHNHLDPNALPLEILSSNPQRPWHMPCHNPKGYQVVTLTYTRKRLVGKWGKMERNIPAFI